MLVLNQASLARPFALGPLSQRVRPGELLGIIGPNGAGKSTLLALLSGFLEPAGGSVLLDGRALAEWSVEDLAARRALVAQRIESAFDWSVEAFIRLGQRHSAELLPTLADALDLMPLLERGVQSLSGGELQRVTIARALNQLALAGEDAPERPRLLLLDEPTSALDVGQQQRLMRLLRRQVVGPRVAVVCVLHDLNLAARYCDRLWLMADGRLCADGTPAEVLSEDVIARVFAAQVRVIRRGERAVVMELLP
ncbi:hypothetical protein AN467_13630 [Pseudomonas aeruginosa]|uniref:ATP-binding cassette domain-containing protein n=1 Tax=Pseudomonas aeruginosa TaxID=287 RepID=UPI00053E2BC6|nr:ATP-binding cassette domain-containing protein [Pseudomonas aeruginosa]MBI8144596.1 ATP-binding cassette domain-containing protein [Pseudomonas aeruginosa]MBX5686374.1 ATP-binding cassette domain-containing protein [Pseudomonas aeruginosa]MBX5789048.1 ATP-binding cassette domain-containing protein [Pseudomonas aeruginosa]MCT5136902.1 ATP-binding cassette domain-containing protein [Pseudomonas aeruginosa]MCV4096402.1 ATP-binding cassette domain-containing protein [Pseudomonas aeruginosa]